MYAKKKNLKTYNQNEMNDHKIFINESLTKRRIDLLVTTKRLLKEKHVDSVWTYDGRIMVKTFSGKKWNITRTTDVDKLMLSIESARRPLASTPATAR